MRVLVDTSVWSTAFRRKKELDIPEVLELRRLVTKFQASIIGPIRQELLSGIKEKSQYNVLRDLLRAFPDLSIESNDYEQAAAFLNTCRTKGIQGSNTDFLICAVASRHEMSIFTCDEDFVRFAKYLPIKLHDID